jgi:hypothetical protein
MARYQQDGLAVILFPVLLAAAVALAGWVTHVIWAIRMLANEKGATMGQMVLAGIGAFMPPIGTIHGWMIWFGAGF